MQTSRSQLEIALGYQRILADAMPILVMMADPDGTVNFFNRAWFDFTGQPPFERDIERDWTRYIHPDDVQKVAADWTRGVAEHQDVIDMEYRLHDARTGAYRWVSARATALRDEFGDIMQWIGTAMDVDDARSKANAFSEIAEAYQSASLPTIPHSIGGLRFSAQYRASTRYLSACGDWYDAFEVDEGCAAVCIGDVGGHGLEAATMMAKYRMSLRALTTRAEKLHNGGPESVLKSVEDAISLDSPEANATAFLGIISADRRELTWCSAGHPPPLLVRHDGSMQWITAGEPPLGWAFGIERTAQTLSLQGARALVLYTDGLLEASRDLVHGMQQLQDVVRSGIHKDDLALHIIESWKPAPVEDDVAVLTVSF